METGENHEGRGSGDDNHESELGVPRSETPEADTRSDSAERASAERASADGDERELEETTLSALCGDLCESFARLLKSLHNEDKLKAAAAQTGEHLSEVLSLFLVPRETPSVAEEGQRSFRVDYSVMVLLDDAQQLQGPFSAVIEAETVEEAIKLLRSRERESLSRQVKVGSWRQEK
jgi:hypothetical protein